ncbi:hypothetical protein FBU30_001686 [Linnemannia zychae]|nr:hypothetical protein FBU30_001686 [Linnemannia zychae]
MSKIITIARFLIPKVPLLVSTTLVHYAYGPAKPSWSYRFSVTVALFRAFVTQLNEVPLNQTKAMFKLMGENAPVPEGAIIGKSKVPVEYRNKAAEIMEQLLSLQGIDSAKLGWNWKNDPAGKEPLLGEWTEAKVKDEKYNEGRTVLYFHGGAYILGSVREHRWASWHMARHAGAKVFSVEYRLAPESPFPAAVQDALSAYLYLLNPPADASMAAVDPKNIVIMGDSAGGGLAFATILAIRDAGLPVPAGIVGWSPWLDLLHSMPSVLLNSGTDYLPAEGITHGGQGSLQKIAKLAVAVEANYSMQNHPELPRIQYYASNAVLDCTYVSPLVEKNLEGICPMLITLGDAEMLRDESIVFAQNSKNASSQLFIYDDMPHVHQVFDYLPSAQDAIQRSAEFIRQVTLGGMGMVKKSSYRVSVSGQVRPLEDNAVIGWETRVGKLGGGQEILAQL